MNVDKETYVHSTSDPKHHAALTYNLLEGLQLSLCKKFDDLHTTLSAMQAICGKRIDVCDKRYLRRAFRRIPASWLEIVLAVFTLGLLVGLGILTLKDVITVVG